MQNVQALKPNDRSRRAAFAEEILQHIDDGNYYPKCLIFSDETSFHVSRKANKHDLRIWGSQNPYRVEEKNETVPNLLFGVV